MLLDLLQAFQQTNAWPAPAHKIRVALSECVHLAEPERINLKLLAQILHSRFECEVRLRACGCSISAGTGLISRDNIAANIDMGTAIDAGEMEATEACEEV